MQADPCVSSNALRLVQVESWVPPVRFCFFRVFFIVKLSGVITIDKSDTHAKVKVRDLRSQRSKQILPQFGCFQTVTPVWIHTIPFVSLSGHFVVVTWYLMHIAEDIDIPQLHSLLLSQIIHPFRGHWCTAAVFSIAESDYTSLQRTLIYWSCIQYCWVRLYIPSEDIDILQLYLVLLSQTIHPFRGHWYTAAVFSIAESDYTSLQRTLIYWSCIQYCWVRLYIPSEDIDILQLYLVLLSQTIHPFRGHWYTAAVFSIAESDYTSLQRTLIYWSCIQYCWVRLYIPSEDIDILQLYLVLLSQTIHPFRGHWYTAAVFSIAESDYTSLQRTLIYCSCI